MPHMTLTLNGVALLDGQLDDWKQQPPEAMLQYLKPESGHTQPWVRPTMVAFADAALMQRDVEIHVQTREGGAAYSVSVNLSPNGGGPNGAAFDLSAVQKMNT